MDGMFNIFGYGMQRPDERDKTEKRGFFWADRDKEKSKSNLNNFDFTSMGGTGALDQKGKQLLPSDTNYPGNINQMQNKNITHFNPSQGGDQQGASVNEDMGFMSRLANMAGVDMKEATANWKDKGGFEGLMSNPGFTLGLALMQSSAQGKTIGAGVLDNFVKAAGISAQFKDRMDARKQAPIQATSGDIAEVKSLLGSMNISDPSNIEKLFGKGNVQLKFDMAAEDIANELQKEMAKLQKAVKPGQPPLVFDTTRKFKILERMLKSGKFKKKGGTWFTDATLESQTKVPLMARGGPVRANKAYVVGERGPEYFLPKESGKIVSNDDSRIFAMLLAANPQLQQVSKTRAERIIRSRFPEYFD